MTESTTRLAGKLALVTGASAGIGRATALALAHEGCEVIATGRRSGELEALENECRAFGGQVRSIAGDLADAGFVQRLAAQSAEADIFVNNAGLLTYAPLLELTERQNEEMFQVNVLASIRMCQLMAQSMVSRKHGHIVMITSLSARTIRPHAVIYGATKHAMAAVAKGLRAELATEGLKVTEIAPGMVDTDIRNNSTHPAVLKAMAARSYTPLSPGDVAQAVVYAVCTPANCCPDLIELRPTHA